MVRGGCLLLLLHRNGREIEKGRKREREWYWGERRKDGGDIRRNPRGSLVYFNQDPLAPHHPLNSLSLSFSFLYLHLISLCRIALRS